MVDGMRCSARLAAARRVMANVSAVEGDDPATVVMGMDQHRAQITAEWIDTITGEISTARIAPPGSAATARLIAVARKLLKRSYHLLCNLGDQALEPETDTIVDFVRAGARAGAAARVPDGGPAGPCDGSDRRRAAPVSHPPRHPQPAAPDRCRPDAGRRDADHGAGQTRRHQLKQLLRADARNRTGDSLHCQLPIAGLLQETRPRLPAASGPETC
jgi:hypothetical protein